MKSYKELEVWQKSVNLAIETYRMAKKFPQEERFGLTAQVQRATTSVPANIAEGWGERVNQGIYSIFAHCPGFSHGIRNSSYHCPPIRLSW